MDLVADSERELNTARLSSLLAHVHCLSEHLNLLVVCNHVIGLLSVRTVLSKLLPDWRTLVSTLFESGR